MTHPIKNLPLKLSILTLMMFGFGFGLVPLYDVFCEITGINGKGFERLDDTQKASTFTSAISLEKLSTSTEKPDTSSTEKPDTSSNTPDISTQGEVILTSSTESTLGREITVQFLSQPQSGFSGNFYPADERLQVPIEKSIQTMYVARNALDKRIHLQAIPSIAPAEAAAHVTKIECFCFQEQYLEAGQQREMSLVFSIAETLPNHIQKITFSYSLYPAITGGQDNEPNT